MPLPVETCGLLWKYSAMIRRHHTRPPATSPIRANPDPSTRRPHRQGGWPFYRMDRSSTDRPPTWLVKVIRRTAVAETPTRYLLLANVRTANIWPHCLRPSCCVLMLPSSPLQIFYDLISSCEAPIQLPRGCRLGVVPSAKIAMGSAGGNRLLSPHQGSSVLAAPRCSLPYVAGKPSQVPNST